MNIDITLDTALLAEALGNFKRKYGRGAYAEIKEVSGVSNIGRIEKQKYIATIESWLKLHLSFPDDIPPPTTIDGRVIVILGEGKNYIPLHNEDNQMGTRPIPGEKKLERLYLRNRSRAIVALLTEVIARVEKNGVQDERSSNDGWKVVL
jgi:hypothetical protein